MDHPVRGAFCPLLFAANGGKVEGGRLIRPPGMRVQGKCRRAFDCNTCPLMIQWLRSLEQQGWIPSWECTGCIQARAAGTSFHLPGFYTSGRTEVVPAAPSVMAVTGHYDNSDVDRPILTGCMGCRRQSSFLQLVLRRRDT